MQFTDKVRESAKFIHDNSTHVQINENLIEDFTQWISQQEYVKYDEMYHPKSEELNFEQSVSFIFFVDTINFCFWPYQLEYEQLCEFLLKGVKSGKYTIDYFSEVAQEEFYEEFSKLFKVQNLDLLFQRYNNLKEISQKIKLKFGNFLRFLEKSNLDAEILLEQIVTEFPCFQDHCVYKQRQVFFLKRAQILVGDLNEALKSLSKTNRFEGEEQILLEKFSQKKNFDNLEKLTSFPDYRIPQVLHYKKIFQYSQTLNNKIMSQSEIAPGSEEESEIRGNMLYVISKIAQDLQKTRNITDIEIDWILWQYGEFEIKDKHPHHRTPSIFY